jgi:hypothetical protein
MSHVPRLHGIALLTMAIVAAVPIRAAAECGPRPANVCELVNSDDDIFAARVLAAVPDDPFSWRVRVVRTYRGVVSGDIVVRVFSHGDLPAPAHLEIGQSYLLYTSRDPNDGIRKTPLVCGQWQPLSRASREELGFLERLNRRTVDGRIFGRLMRPAPGFTHEPVAGVSVTAESRAATFNAVTDASGRFDISRLAAGTYRVSARLPNQLIAEEEVELVPHGCVDAYLVTEPNTAISGRINLPLGLQVTGTLVTAVGADGRPVETAQADSFGRYAITGLAPGDYTIGINVSTPPHAGAPFPSTFAPAAIDRAQARVVRLTEAGQVTDVNVSVSRRSDMLTIPVRSTFADGTPVRQQTLRLSTTGYGEHGGGTTSSEDGLATIEVVRGVRVYLLGGSRDGCITPLPLGPDAYPETIVATFTPEGCRQEHNLSALGRLQSSVRGETTTMRARVTLPDTTPVYKARVSIVSAPGRGPFISSFQTAEDGTVDIPVPLGQELFVEARAPEGAPTCAGPRFIVNTENGFRAQASSDRQAGSAWREIPPSPAAITLVLTGGSCSR